MAGSFAAHPFGSPLHFCSKRLAPCHVLYTACDLSNDGGICMVPPARRAQLLEELDQVALERRELVAMLDRIATQAPPPPPPLHTPVHLTTMSAFAVSQSL